MFREIPEYFPGFPGLWPLCNICTNNSAETYRNIPLTKVAIFMTRDYDFIKRTPDGWRYLWLWARHCPHRIIVSYQSQHMLESSQQAFTQLEYKLLLTQKGTWESLIPLMPQRRSLIPKFNTTLGSSSHIHQGFSHFILKCLQESQ